jgi:uncharacterized protein
MADFDKRTVNMQAGAYAVDEGLRAYMLRVYNYMAMGLAITGIAAYAVAQYVTSTVPTEIMLRNGTYLTKFGETLYGVPGRYIIFFAPLVLVFLLAARVHKMSVPAAQLTFWVYAALVGVSLSAIFLIYTPASITRVFFITAASFGSLSLYGYTTKKDLSGWGSFLFMGLIGIVIASIVNIWTGSDALQFAISAIGVVVFAGLTAYDTQTIKETYYAADDEVVAGRKAILGALNLYLDFVNLFIMLMQLLGSRD